MLSLTLAFQKSKCLQIGFSTGNSLELCLTKNKFNSLWAKSIIEGNSSSTERQRCKMSATPFLSVLRVNTHESIFLIVLTIDLIHKSESDITLGKVINSLFNLTPGLPYIWRTFLSFISCSEPITVNQVLSTHFELFGHGIDTFSTDALVGMLVTIINANEFLREAWGFSTLNESSVFYLWSLISHDFF